MFYTAALLGHQALNSEEARKAAELFKLDPAVATILTGRPLGELENAPPGSLIYRFYEIVQGYGPTLKALSNEEFGDGIMSAIDFLMKQKSGRVSRRANSPSPHSRKRGFSLVACAQVS